MIKLITGLNFEIQLGLNLGSTRFSPKYTLCGDLNQGFVPKNPMGQNVLGQPYPL